MLALIKIGNNIVSFQQNRDHSANELKRGEIEEFSHEKNKKGESLNIYFYTCKEEETIILKEQLYFYSMKKRLLIFSYLYKKGKMGNRGQAVIPLQNPQNFS